MNKDTNKNECEITPWELHPQVNKHFGKVPNEVTPELNKIIDDFDIYSYASLIGEHTFKELYEFANTLRTKGKDWLLSEGIGKTFWVPLNQEYDEENGRWTMDHLKCKVEGVYKHRPHHIHLFNEDDFRYMDDEEIAEVCLDCDDTEEKAIYIHTKIVEQEGEIRDISRRNERDIKEDLWWRCSFGSFVLCSTAFDEGKPCIEVNNKLMMEDWAYHHIGAAINEVVTMPLMQYHMGKFGPLQLAVQSPSKKT
jgi:hypothetical protein